MVAYIGRFNQIAWFYGFYSYDRIRLDGSDSVFMIPPTSWEIPE